MNNNSRNPRSWLGRLIRHSAGRWAVVVILALVLAAAIGPHFMKYTCAAQPDPGTMKYLPPSREHPLGTDRFSRDVLSRMFCGARISLEVATLAVVLSMTVGTAYGLVAGYVGGRVDSIMMRILDGFLSIPRVMLVLLILTLADRPSLAGLILLLGATGWFGVSRLVRAETLSAKTASHVEAARALGASNVRILWSHLLPNVTAPVIVTATLSVGTVIALEAGLSYLGIGAPEPSASWGSLFNEGAAVMQSKPWLVLFPGLAIVGTVLAFNVLGDALRDVLDPRQLHGSREQPLPVSLASGTPVTQLSENG